MSVTLVNKVGTSAELLQPLTDLDMTKILTLIDVRMKDKDAEKFASIYFCSDAAELGDRLLALDELKKLTSAAELQEGIDALKAIEKEQEYLKTAKSRITDVLQQHRVLCAYVNAVLFWNRILDSSASGTSGRIKELRTFFQGLKKEPLFASCQQALKELDEAMPLPRYIHVGMNLREDGFPVEMGVITTEGHIDLSKEKEINDPELNALLSAVDTSMPSKSAGPEFVYHRGIYGSHFDEYLQHVLEHEWKNKIAKAAKILSKIKITAIDEMLSFAEPLQFYQIGLLCAEAFEKRGYALCRPEPKANTSLKIRSALYPDFILRNDGIQGNDLTLKKGNAVIITGPNHSGKTSYLKTIGQCYMLAQLGFFVPAASMVFEPVTNIFTLFSAGEDSSMTASRMGVEVKKLTEILKKASSTDLILLNEPMTSTNPVEAVAICADLTRHFLEVGATHLLVTHLYDIYYLLKAQLSSDLLPRMESLITQSHYDEVAGNMVHSYRLVAHEPLGNSYARETAAAYGVTLEAMIADETLLAQANRYCDAYNKDSVYEGEDSNGLSDDTGR